MNRLINANMAAEAGVVFGDVLAENGVFLPLKSVEEVERFVEKLENDTDCRNKLVCVVMNSFKKSLNLLFKLFI